MGWSGSETAQSIHTRHGMSFVSCYCTEVWMQKIYIVRNLLRKIYIVVYINNNNFGTINVMFFKHSQFLEQTRRVTFILMAWNHFSSISTFPSCQSSQQPCPRSIYLHVLVTVVSYIISEGRNKQCHFVICPFCTNCLILVYTISRNQLGFRCITAIAHDHQGFLCKECFGFYQIKRNTIIFQEQ